MSAAYKDAVRAQLQAADPAQSVFVTANAGSGKTKVLIDRIARLLLAGAAPASFLCITFTKAAATEMQRRLFERLGAWCVADDARLTAELEALGEPAPDAGRLALARTLFAAALETPGGLRIQTIHSFCERLLARFPLEAGVPPGFEIADDARTAGLLGLAWAKVVRGGAPDIEAALDRFGARLHADAFSALVAALAQARGAVAGIVADAGGLDGARATVMQRHGEAQTAAQIRDAFTAAFDWNGLDQLASILESGAKSDMKAAQRLREALSSRTFEALCAALLKDDFTPYAKVGTKALRDDHAAAFGDFDSTVAALCAAWARCCAAERAQDAAGALALGAAIAEAYGAAKAASGALDFEDLITHANALLHDGEAAAWVLYKLDGGLTHILIDEGQDTSPAQWRLVEPLQVEFFAGEGAGGWRRNDGERTVFAVGDPKQSIYSFQGADPAQFLGQAQALSKRAAAAEKAFAAPMLAMSFRSAPDVLAAVDATFDGLDLADGPGAGEVIKHTAHRANERGRVEFWPMAFAPAIAPSSPWDAPQDVENKASAAAVLCAGVAAAVKGWIEARHGVWEKGRLRPMRAGDVLVLVRSRGPVFTQVLRSLKRAGLPVAGADRIRLAEEISVQDLLAAVKVALDPTDDLSLAAFLKSPFVGLVDDDADIFPLAGRRAKGESLHARLCATQDSRYAAAQETVAALIADAYRPPFDFVSALLERTGADGRSGWRRLYERLGAEARDPVEEAVARALAIARKGPATLQHFVCALEGDSAEVRRETEQDVDAVQVMTVHGAKGLERPAVILADTTAACSDSPSGGVQITTDGLTLRVPAREDDAVTRRVRAERQRAAELEHNRLLYVAMTRARDRLIVCGAARGRPGRAEPGSWWTHVERGLQRAGAVVCDTPFGEGLALGEIVMATAGSASAEAAPATPPWLRTPAAMDEGRAPLAPSRAEGPVLAPRGALQARFQRGKLIHGLLQRLPDVAPARRAEVGLAWARARGADDASAREHVTEALRVLEDPLFAAVFGPGSRAEVPLIAELPEGVTVRGSIDRLLVTEAGVHFIDFKTDRPPPARAEDVAPRILAQMAAYRAALLQVFPQRQISCAIVWTDGPALTPLPGELLDGVSLKPDAS